MSMMKYGRALSMLPACGFRIGLTRLPIFNQSSPSATTMKPVRCAGLTWPSHLLQRFKQM